jgi:hypothetical protein
MFIRPLNTSLVASNTWQDRAGNTHFTLQSKLKDTAMRSLFKNMAIQITVDAQAEYRKSIAEYDYRITLKIASRNKQFIMYQAFDKVQSTRRSTRFILTGIGLNGICI